MENLDERELIEAARMGEQGAYDEIYRRYYWLVFSQAIKATRCEADAHEICQDVFFQVYRSIQDLREPDFFKTWLFRITHAKCVDMFRKSRVQYYEDSDIASMSKDIEQRVEYNPIQHIHKDCDEIVLDSMLQKLSPKHRDVIEKMYFQQMSLQEIADLKGVSVNTIKTRVFHARKELKTMIRKYERTQGVQLDFHAQGFLPMLSGFSFMNWLKKSSSVTKILQGSAYAFVVGGVLYIGASQVLPDLRSSLKPQAEVADSMRLNEITTNEKIDGFQPVWIRNIECTSAVQGYQMLTEWADHTTIDTKPKEEKDLYQPLVEEMKAHGGTYYTMLHDSGWITAFEK